MIKITQSVPLYPWCQPPPTEGKTQSVCIPLNEQTHLWWYTWQTIVKGMFFFSSLLKKIGKTDWIGAWTTTLGRALYGEPQLKGILFTDAFLWPFVLAFLGHVSYSCNQLTTPCSVAPSHPILTWDMLLETGQQRELLNVDTGDQIVSLFLTSVGYSSSPDWFWLHRAPKVFE